MMSGTRSLSHSASRKDDRSKGLGMAMPHIDYFVGVFPEAVAEGIGTTLPGRSRSHLVGPCVCRKTGRARHLREFQAKAGNPPTIPDRRTGFHRSTGSAGAVYTRRIQRPLMSSSRPANSRVVGDEAKWVLALDGTRTEGVVANPSMVGDSLRGMYLREYAAEWWNALSSVRIAPFENLSDAANRMRTLGDMRNSPLKLALR